MRCAKQVEVSTVGYDQWGWPCSSFESIEKIVKNLMPRFDSRHGGHIPVNLNGDGVSADVFDINQFQSKQYILSLFVKTLGLCTWCVLL